jgi:hypothetical protein
VEHDHGGTRPRVAGFLRKAFTAIGAQLVAYAIITDGVMPAYWKHYVRRHPALADEHERMRCSGRLARRESLAGGNGYNRHQQP